MSASRLGVKGGAPRNARTAPPLTRQENECMMSRRAFTLVWGDRGGPPALPAMNAPNPLMPEPRPLSEATLEQLRRAVQERRRSPAADDAPLQAALQAVASEARDRS